MPYFDFHVHPTLKTLFSPDNDPLSPFEKIDTRKIPGLMRALTDLELVLTSQSNLTQLIRNQVKLIGVPIFIPDQALLVNKLLTEAADGKLEVYISKERLEKLAKGNPFQNVFDEDIPRLTKARNPLFPDKKVNVLRFRDEFIEDNPMEINAFFTLEGIHSLCEAPNDYNFTIIQRNLSTLQEKYPIVSANLCHMERSDLCVHAYGIQFMSDDRFIPSGNGISRLGYQIIHLLTDLRILIDIKHMSVRSRMDLYKYYRDNNIDQPLICTHAGLTGISWKEAKDYIFGKPQLGDDAFRLQFAKPVKYGRIPRPSFNSTSINLYDEDVEAILRSGGIIGISLDKRILGYDRYINDANVRPEYPMEQDYISIPETAAIVPNQNNRLVIGQAIEQDKCLDWQELSEAGLVNPRLELYHLAHFMQQVIHIFEIARKAGYDQTKAMHQICLGSDFDGLINPVICCDSVDELDEFKAKFIEHFVPFCIDSKVALPNGFDIHRFAEQLFYENGKSFVLNQLPTAQA